MKLYFALFMFLLIFLVGCNTESETNINNEDNTMVVENGDTVAVHYKGTLDDNSVFDSSEGRDPLTFTVGSGAVIKGFDDGVLGLKEGESRKVSIEPVNAYGEYDNELVREVPLDTLPEGAVVGSMLSTQTGQQILVKSIQGNSATLDPNHALAGKRLHFEIEVVSIEKQ